MTELLSTPPVTIEEPSSGTELVPVPQDRPATFGRLAPMSENRRIQFAEAYAAWLAKSPSLDTRSNYRRDLQQFLVFVRVPAEQLERLAEILPRQVAAWRDSLQERGLTNSSIRRKMTVLRSLFSYLQTYGYAGANPAHSDFVEAPPVPRDGKTVGLAPEDCRRLLDAPALARPVGVRDAAVLAVLAYTGCWLGELCRLRAGDYKSSSGHKLLEIQGNGGKERRVPLHAEAVERLEAWLDAANLHEELAGPLFRPVRSARSGGEDGFRPERLRRRSVQLLMERYVRRLGLDPGGDGPLVASDGDYDGPRARLRHH